jgi:flotillin
MAGNVPVIMAKVMESVKESTGIDISEIVRADTYEGKTTTNLNVTGLSSESDGTNPGTLSPAVTECTDEIK